jgi:hypothetical protein
LVRQDAAHARGWPAGGSPGAGARLGDLARAGKAKKREGVKVKPVGSPPPMEYQFALYLAVVRAYQKVFKRWLGSQ